jgi:prolipoprotein diacylglyceryltransferase
MELSQWAQSINVNWYVIPMVLIISLAYSASQYELPEKIIRIATKRFFYILAFMAVAFVILWALSDGL